MVEIHEIKCRLRRGMFPDEWVVLLDTIAEDGSRREVESIAYGESVSVERSVEGVDEVPGRLKAYVVGRTGGTASVVLPQPTQTNGPSVRVPESELVEG